MQILLRMQGPRPVIDLRRSVTVFRDRGNRNGS